MIQKYIFSWDDHKITSFTKALIIFGYGKDNTIDKGKYLNVWKREGGDWKLFTHMWNTNLREKPIK